jgi:hypothetical protein
MVVKLVYEKAFRDLGSGFVVVVPAYLRSKGFFG